MNRDHIPYVLYDLSLAIGSELRLEPLLIKTLQRLLFHSGFPVGLVLLDQARVPKGIQGRLHAVIGDHVLQRHQGQQVCWPASLLDGPPRIIDGAAEFDAIRGSRTYLCGLRLPVGENGSILLLAESFSPEVRGFADILQPILRNLDRAIRLVRNNERLTQTLETDLARSQHLLQSVIDTAPAMIFWKSRKLRYLGCNPSFAAAAGFSSPLEVIGKDDHELVWAAQADGYQADDLMVMESGQPKIGYEERMTTPAGNVIWLRSSKVPLRGADGNVIGVLGLAEDITESKEVEDALQSSEARYRAAFETSLDAITIHRMDDGTLIDCNLSFLQATGLQRDEVIGRITQDMGLWSDPAEHGKLLEELERAGHVRNLEAEFISRDGRKIWGLVSTSQVTVDGIPCRLSVIRDISELKAAREELELQQQLLEQRIEERTAQLEEAKSAAESANAAKSVFLANMSHEIRTPLNVINGMAHLLRRSGLTPEQSGRIDKLLGASQHLLHTLGAVLDLAKIEAGKMALESSPLCIENLVSHVASMMRERIEAKGLRLITRLDPTPADLLGDVVRLRQALLNLAENALKFTDHGSILILVRNLESNPDSTLLGFEVTDTGIGIAPEMLPRLFQPFEQAENSTTRTYGGTGLGLTITRELAELMGGRMGASSTPGEGSTFWFTARLNRMPGGKGTGPISPGDSETLIPQRHHGKPVLLVEDDPANLEITSLLLRSVGLEVDTACDGLDALQAVARRQYALVIMDVQMPNMDGLQTTRQLRLHTTREQLPVVAMTAGAFAEDRENCLAAGMNDFITKPITPDGLYQAVLTWLDRSPFPNQNPDPPA